MNKKILLMKYSVYFLGSMLLLLVFLMLLEIQLIDKDTEPLVYFQDNIDKNTYNEIDIKYNLIETSTWVSIKII